eukprot:COSAG06_NODE_6185_length_3060_cov_8.926242_3_plen_229_part_00
MDLVPPNSDQAYIDLTGESSEDEPPLDAGAAAEYIADDRSEITSDDSEEEPPAAAADEEEEETLAQRVKRRGNRRQRSHGSGSYQDLATQQALAHEEAARLAGTVEVRDVPGMGQGLFAVRDLRKGELKMSYFGQHYPGYSHFLTAYPQDDAAYAMEHRGEFFDGAPIEQLAKYVNHSRKQRNLAFTDDEDSPFVQLELTKNVRAGQQLFTDYGPSYAYEVHGFSRDV